MLEQPTVQKAAAAVGISDVTLWRWMQEADFQQRLRAARRQAYAQSLARLQQASPAAVGTLLRVMADPTAPAASRVRAADCVLNHTSQAIELDDIAGRLSELEQAQTATKESPDEELTP